MDDARFYRMQAERCHELALRARSPSERKGHEQLARHYEREARRQAAARAEARA